MRIFTDHSIVENTVGLDLGTCCNLGILNDTTRTNFDIIAKFTIAFDNHVDVDTYVLTDCKIAT
ncbi:hypothetical protein SDC9_176749 [bioreactor metagenome]|uniref:Uncharacterized protein n=1 Tax=bioreactor metagenome TaxID=1076179 RepID=A0A645GQX6_9ZZZZ